MIPLLLCGVWLSHLGKQVATNKADSPGAGGWSSKDDEMNMRGVCIKDGSMFFLKLYSYGLLLEVCLIFHLAILIASFCTLSHVGSSDFFILFPICRLRWIRSLSQLSLRLPSWYIQCKVDGMGTRDRAVLFSSGSKCNEKLLWNYQLRHLKQSFWFASFAMEVAILSKE